MAEAPEGYAEYPRDRTKLSYQELKDLTDGYFGQKTVLIINVCLIIGSAVALGVNRIDLTDDDQLGLAGLISVVAFFASLGPNRKVGAGLGWPPAGSWIASLFMALTSTFCFGLIGYYAMRALAMRRVRDYGLEGGMQGLSKRNADAKLARLAQKEGPG